MQRVAALVHTTRDEQDIDTREEFCHPCAPAYDSNSYSCKIMEGASQKSSMSRASCTASLRCIPKQSSGRKRVQGLAQPSSGKGRGPPPSAGMQQDAGVLYRCREV